MLDVGYLLAGLVLLYFGAEWLVGSASRLAVSLGVSPLIVGLTVVAYGTSSPELVVGIGAAINDQGAIALGNVIGSNIANIGLILSITALITPPRIDPSLRGREVGMLLVTTALVPLLLLDGTVQPWESAGLLALAIGYTVWTVRAARSPAATGVPRATSDAEATAEARTVADAADAAALGAVPAGGRARLILLGLAGLALLVGGGHLLVEGAVGVARTLGMSERLIGLTIVAVGTSLPELATSVLAALRGHSDIAVGNVVGSNIFNAVLILGASGITGSIHATPGDIALDLGVLGGMTVLAALVIRTRARVSRPEGVLLLAGYAAFLASLALGV